MMSSAVQASGHIARPKTPAKHQKTSRTCHNLTGFGGVFRNMSEADDYWRGWQ
jgi:hypothetical protein